MADDLVVDSNILIALLQGKDDLADLLLDKGLYVSVITRIELYSYAGIDPRNNKWVSEMLDQCEVIELDRTIQDETIRLRRKCKLPIADAIIGATANTRGLALFTADKDFKKCTGEIKVIFYES